LDTDVASLLHRGTLAGQLATRLIGREPLITFVTFGELAKWAEIRNWGQHRREELTSWLSRIAVLPGDEAVATTWGRLSAAAVRRGRPRPVNDMWVAAYGDPAIEELDRRTRFRCAVPAPGPVLMGMGIEHPSQGGQLTSQTTTACTAPIRSLTS
jgi:predicted nucleic acid-binding protein